MVKEIIYTIISGIMILLFRWALTDVVTQFPDAGEFLAILLSLILYCIVHAYSIEQKHKGV